jgi:hypothetical protein
VFLTISTVLHVPFYSQGIPATQRQKDGETTETMSGKPDIGKDSKTVYINDSYNLNTIPFDVENIIDEITEEDVE